MRVAKPHCSHCFARVKGCTSTTQPACGPYLQAVAPATCKGACISAGLGGAKRAAAVMTALWVAHHSRGNARTVPLFEEFVCIGASLWAGFWNTQNALVLWSVFTRLLMKNVALRCFAKDCILCLLNSMNITPCANYLFL